MRSQRDWTKKINELIEALENVGTGRWNAADELGEIAEANPGNAEVMKAVPMLVKALKDNDADVRYSAAQALGAIGDARVLPDLKRVSESDQDDIVRESASEAINKITKKQR